jgi:creatinine amidohydrolase
VSRGRAIATLTWPEVEALLQDYRVLMIPLGACTKEHGPHLPLNNDWILAEALAARVLSGARVLQVPPVGYSYYPAFLEYPGSVHIGLETAAALICDICRSFARHGMRKFYVLNTGISTCWALEPARRTLQEEGLLLEYTDLKADTTVETSLRESEGGTHADEIETSMMLHLAPEVVRADKIVRDYHPSKGPGGLTRDPESETGVYSATGVWGDPTLATAEKGRVIVEARVGQIVSFLERFARDDFVPEPPRAQYL